MRFGKIDYLNLLPFEVFMKQYPKTAQTRAFYSAFKSYPAKLNRQFLFGKIDAGFISSIMASRNFKGRSNPQIKALSAGIIAKKRIDSVIVLHGENKNDYQSASSNALARVLGVNGRVLIGDRALKEVLKIRKNYQKDSIESSSKKHEQHEISANLIESKNKKFTSKKDSIESKPLKDSIESKKHIESKTPQEPIFSDLASIWWGKNHLPFVFGRLCARREFMRYSALCDAFSNSTWGKNALNAKIPRYILAQYSRTSGIKESDILEYLRLLSYKITPKCRFSIARFYRALRLLRLFAPNKFK